MSAELSANHKGAARNSQTVSIFPNKEDGVAARFSTTRNLWQDNRAASPVLACRHYSNVNGDQHEKSISKVVSLSSRPCFGNGLHAICASTDVQEGKSQQQRPHRASSLRRRQRLGARQQWQPVHLQREKFRIGEQYLSKPNCSWRRQCGSSRCSLGAEFFRQYLPRHQDRVILDLLPSSRCP